ncbi:hypothetical protein M3084_03555, partial [Succinatimonas hippei]|uniref:beta strand repeat-containing protein n=1 Tax=Succinatimonas hippei TaxID=626938 RepID=UPI0020133EF8
MRNAKKSEFKLTKIALAVSSVFCMVQPALAVPSNTQLPTGGNVVVGSATVPPNPTGSTLTIEQSSTTTVIKWDNFSIGADATVNFVGKNGKDFIGYNSVNFVNSGKVSEIYGQVNAKGGNIVIANSAGVQIGSSAQINVGSIYVTNKELSDEFVKANINVDSTIADIKNTINKAQNSAAELMSLGGIVTEGTVTFDGDRVVIDTDHLYKNTDGELLADVSTDHSTVDLSKNLVVKSKDKNNVVLGYTAEYVTENGVTKVKQEDQGKKVKVSTALTNDGFADTSNTEQYDGFVWVENLMQLQAINSDLDGNFALRNSIDANYSADENYEYATTDLLEQNKGFDPIGNGSNAFTGKFDGLGYDIFDLNIKGNNDYVGLFGKVENATIRNFTLNSGAVSGKNYVGSAIGHADNSRIENIINTADIFASGNDVGGIVGYAKDSTLSGLINTGTVTVEETAKGLNYLGGIVGHIEASTINGETYNLGAVKGDNVFNVGGIVGLAKDSTIGNSLDNDKNAFQIYNQLNVTGSYNVGGIAGKIEGTTVTNAANFGTILAKGSTKEEYLFHSNDKLSGTVTYKDPNNNLASVEVKAANAGGIVGNAGSSSTTNNKSVIKNTVNSGDVYTESTLDNNAGTYYHAGNVGGIVGRAEDTEITNGENKENNIAGAHNVGGVAGYLTGKSFVSVGINNGGNITATGARLYNGSDFAKESIRNPENNGNYAEGNLERFNIGNIGGIVGYMYGDDAYVTSSGNRGTVHSSYFEGNTVPESAQAANVGGIVGKVDRSKTNDKNTILSNGSLNIDKIAVSNSYSTGEVQGYTGVGGVVGLMYNGEVAGSYNLGTLRSTRQNALGTAALNMGGIVGDTTEGTDARVLIYDVYNSGTIGDENFEYYGRHIGGIVGRLSGTVEKAYNTGNIYNGSNVVGGIAGYWNAGSITNVFNTGNITVSNKNTAQSQVGGIAGAANIGSGNLTLLNAYNIGVLRSFKDNSSPDGKDVLGGIVGYLVDYGTDDGTLNISNVYTMGNLYVDIGDLGQILGGVDGTASGNRYQISSAVYIEPNRSGIFTSPKNNQVTTIAFDERNDRHVWEQAGFSFSSQNGASVENVDNIWRIYEGTTTPILNAFLPNTEGYFSQAGNMEGIESIQYGTAVNPLLTIINVEKDHNLTLDWGWGANQIGLSGAAGLAVYGGDLTINDFTSLGDGRYFGGTIFTDGMLTVNGKEGEDSYFNLGASANLFGDSVTLNSKGQDISIYGSVTATDGDVEIASGDADIEILGKITATPTGQKAVIDGIHASNSAISFDINSVRDKNSSVARIESAYRVENTSTQDGDIEISSNGTANVLFGHLGNGAIVVGADGQFTVNGTESVYVDSDLSGVKGNISLSSTNGEVLLDITNIANAHTSNSDPTGKETLHNFLENFALGNKTISLSGKNNDEKIAIDMWSSDGTGFDLKKYDLDSKTLVESLNNLNVSSNNQTVDLVHIWINSAEQLDGIQRYYNLYKDSGTGILGYNFALKDNIDASVLTEYEAIGTETVNGFTGTFDGRNYRIVGLSVGEKYEDGKGDPPSSSGIFSSVGKDGTVENLRVYGSSFYGMDYAGAIAGKNEGTISNITTLGNHVEVFGSKQSTELDRRDPSTSAIYQAHVGAAGGIVGLNKGTISDITVSDSIIAGSSGEGTLAGNILATAGGISGINEGSISNVTVDSAITANEADTYSLGGIAGYNSQTGKINNAFNTGVTHGEYGDGNITSNSVGGIVGVNVGSVSNVFNSSDVTGGDYVGGVVGYNSVYGTTSDSGKISNAVNAGDIFSDFYDEQNQKYYSYSGGLAGYNAGSIENGRNTGEIHGGNNVGGMVGGNAKDATLNNLSNSIFAEISGQEHVGGIAGSNEGDITAENLGSLVNEGIVKGNKYVGGIAGQNSGTIENVATSTRFEVVGTDASYFGGIAGQNIGTISNATNTGNLDLSDKNVSYVGGIVGLNGKDEDPEDGIGLLKGTISNTGNVSGKKYVGGVAGKNNNTSLLNNTDTTSTAWVITNSGTVSGEGAAGIFYENNSDINNVILTNEKTIKNIPTSSGSQDYSNYGGLFGINTGDITNSTLINNGTVEGVSNVGGVIGYNTGKISTSSIINKGTVSGTGDNIGGLIGRNEGDITGGRTDAVGTDVGYYKYQIINNGSVSGGNNVGGLIGANSTEYSSLSAAYNTGTVFATGDSIGGIVGTNEGKVDQVFNTVMMEEETQNPISGGSNVGGIVGSNSGTLSNAYNTSEISGTTNAGNVAGSNTGTISYVYATNVSGLLVGPSTGTIEKSYSFSTEDKQVSGVTYLSEDKRQKLSEYEDFIDDKWKNYDGSGTPMLSVFLTKLKIDPDKLNEYLENNKLVYNGKEQDLSISDLIYNKIIIGPDGMTNEELESLVFEAYNNTLINDKSSLLFNTYGQKDAGNYSNWLASTQIASSNQEGVFNPNNLGYDIELSAVINKKTITIADLLATIVYGDQKGAGYEITGGELEGIVYGDE